MYTTKERVVLGLGIIAFTVSFLFYTLNAEGYRETDNNYIYVFKEYDNPFEETIEDKLYSELDSAIEIADARAFTESRKRAEEDLQEQIREEIRLGEIEMLAQLIEAEAGNQDYIGKCLVADTVLNRRDGGWGETIEEVIMADYQFSCVFDGGYTKAAWTISDESFKAAYEEYEKDMLERVNGNVLYFTAGGWGKYGRPAFIHDDHYFCY